MTDQQKQATEQEKRDHEEWLHECKMHKIEQMHDFLGERETEGEEE